MHDYGDKLCKLMGIYSIQPKPIQPRYRKIVLPRAQEYSAENKECRFYSDLKFYNNDIYRIKSERKGMTKYDEPRAYKMEKIANTYSTAKNFIFNNLKES